MNLPAAVSAVRLTRPRETTRAPGKCMTRSAPIAAPPLRFLSSLVRIGLCIAASALLPCRRNKISYSSRISNYEGASGRGCSFCVCKKRLQMQKRRDPPATGGAPEMRASSCCFQRSRSLYPSVQGMLSAAGEEIRKVYLCSRGIKKQACRSGSRPFTAGLFHSALLPRALLRPDVSFRIR